MTTAGMRRGGGRANDPRPRRAHRPVLDVFFLGFHSQIQGVIQRIFYVHVPAADQLFGDWFRRSLVGCTFGCEMIASDRAALCAIEGGLVFATLVLTTGPLWGKIAWGTYWTLGTSTDANTAAVVHLCWLYHGSKLNGGPR